MGVNRSSIYYNSILESKDAQLADQIQLIQNAHPFYGYPRVTLELNNRIKLDHHNSSTSSNATMDETRVDESLDTIHKPNRINHKRVYRVMSKFDLKAVNISKRFRKKDDEKFKCVNIPNLLKPTVNQNLLIGPNQVWGSDFTHLWYGRGWMYLFTVIDTFTREILSFNLIDSADSRGVRVTLNQAISKHGQPEIFHSDQGSQYRAYETLALLEQLRINISMSAKSSPWENGRQERFYGNFKAELKYRIMQYKQNEKLNLNVLDLGQFYELVCQQIDYYNNHRIHTALGMPPTKFRQKWYSENTDKNQLNQLNTL